jgi:hypothetical protein
MRAADERIYTNIFRIVSQTYLVDYEDCERISGQPSELLSTLLPI